MAVVAEMVKYSKDPDNHTDFKLFVGLAGKPYVEANLFGFLATSVLEKRMGRRNTTRRVNLYLIQRLQYRATLLIKEGANIDGAWKTPTMTAKIYQNKAALIWENQTFLGPSSQFMIPLLAVTQFQVAALLLHEGAEIHAADVYGYQVTQNHAVYLYGYQLLVILP
ncbi:hypothetical protein Tco_1418905 [Tanacetum coccineum]